MYLNLHVVLALLQSVDNPRIFFIFFKKICLPFHIFSLSLVFLDSFSLFLTSVFYHALHFISFPLSPSLSISNVI